MKEEEIIFTTVHVDGGAFVEPPNYKFHDAYFSVCDDKGNLIFFADNIGNHHNLIAEYRAIEWAIKNITERPIKITSDCTVAIGWAKKGKKKTPKIPYTLPPLIDGSGIIIQYLHGNPADVWNAENWSPKYIK